MPTPPLSDEKRQQIVSLLSEGISQGEVAKMVGVSQGSVSNVAKSVAEAPPASAAPVTQEVDERNGDERTVQKVVNKRIKTLAELAEVCEIDTSEWEIYKWKCVAWQTGMKNPDTKKPFYSQQFSVSAWMRLKRNVIAAKNEIQALRKLAEKYSPKYVPFIHKVPAKSGNLLEISLWDHHFGALIWGRETGHADYDSKIARQCWDAAMEELIARTAHFNPERVVIVLGNDQQNVDNRAGTTERGTAQNSDGRYQKMFEVSRDASRWAIERLTTVAPQVDVVMIAGNHDPLATWHLGDSLQSWFRHAKNISINNEPTARKYYQYGTNLLMFTHGSAKLKIEQYGAKMAAERPDLWGACRWREAHTGDKHHRRVLELDGYTVRILPSLRPPCAWSSENLYIGAIRAAEAFVWNRSEGLVGTACYSILDKVAA